MNKILSWDVGIKNLAYCIIQINEDKTFKIIKWAIINLTDSDEITCCAPLKKPNNKICGKKAKFFCDKDNEIKYYCQTHKSQQEIDVSDFENKHVTNIIDEKCQSIAPRTNKVCNKKANFKIDNDICCKTHKEKILKNKIKELSPRLIKKKNTMDPQKLCEKMYNKLSEIDFKDIDEVYIENQPTHINPIMKSVSSSLLSYFVFLFQSHNSKDKIVKFVAPSSKILITKELVDKINKKITGHAKIKNQECKCRLCKLEIELKANKERCNESNENYTEYKFNYDSTKELGIIYTEKVLEDNNIKDSLDMIKDYVKQDDLCDAFLHGYKQKNKKETK
jgi:hypothetical protein